MDVLDPLDVGESFPSGGDELRVNLEVNILSDSRAVIKF